MTCQTRVIATNSEQREGQNGATAKMPGFLHASFQGELVSRDNNALQL
jgi:hypothetical protein